MKPFNKLVKSKTYHLIKLQNKLYGEVDDYLEKNNLSKKDFAEQLNVSKGYVSQILNGDFDHKLSKLFELSLAIGKIPYVKFIDIDEYKRIQIKERLEKIPLNLDYLRGNIKEKELCLKDFQKEESHEGESLIELKFN